MHPVEDAERLTQIHQNKPSAETEKLFPQPVLKLRVDSKRRDDPQLQEEATLMVLHGFLKYKCLFLLISASKHDITMILERMRKAQISCIALLLQDFFSSRS